jgi:cellulose synthase operon protein C
MLAHGQAEKVVDEFGAARFDKPAANADLQTTLAAAYAALGKADLSQAALASALKADPAYGPARVAVARQKAVAKDFEGAMAATDALLTEQPGNFDAWKLKGDLLLYAQNKPVDALAAYRKSIDANPKFGPAHVALFTLLIEQGKVDEAAKQLEKLKGFAPNSPQTKYLEAQLAYQKKDFKTARELAQLLLRFAPNDARVLHLAGAVELQTNVLPQAEIYLERAAQLAPQDVPVQRMLIVTYLRAGKAAKALAALNASMGKDGIEPSLFSLAGEVHLQNGDAKLAEEYFAKALKLDPNNARNRTALAVTRLAGGQTTAAIDELQNIAGSDSGSTADLALISAHLRRSEFDKALAAIDKLEAKQPDQPLAANLRGRVQLAQKDHAAARKSFERALTIDPNNFSAAASLASMDLADKKPQDAKKRFDSLLAKNPKNTQALLALAQLAVANGAGTEEVAGLLNRAIEANPAEAAPRLLLIELYLRNKDTKLASTAAQSAVSALPNSPEILDALGRVQQATGDLNQAIATFGKVATMQALSTQPLVRLAGAQYAGKNIQAAEQSLRNALEIKADELQVQRLLIILYVEAKRYQEAMTIARTVKQQRPKEAAGFVLEGDIKAAQKDLDAAAMAYRSGLEQVQAPELAVKLHSVLLASGKTAEAERFAADWLKRHPQDLAFISYQGDAALFRKDYALAEKSFLAVLQAQPDNAFALNNLALVSHYLHREGALAYAEKANKLAPNEPYVLDTLAAVLSAKGEHPRAIEVQLKALELKPLDPLLKLNLAKIYIAAGDKTRAKNELEVLAKLSGKNPSQAEAIALLRTL